MGRIALGSARDSRAGDGALAIANFFFRDESAPLCVEEKIVSAKVPKPARVGACAPKTDVRPSDIANKPQCHQLIPAFASAMST